MLLIRSERGDWCDALDGESARPAAELWTWAAAILHQSAQPQGGAPGTAAWTGWRAARGQLEQAAQRTLFLAGLPGLKAPAIAAPVTGGER